MLRKVLVSCAVFIFALGILFTSVLRTAAVRYQTSGVKSGSVLADEDCNVEYNMAYPGSVLPDSPFWPVKALRDKVWLLITTDKLRKVELKILFADKRLGGAMTLFDKGKSETAISTLTKAEKYLEEASLLEEEVRISTKQCSNDICMRLAYASLKHYGILLQLESTVPDDFKPILINARQIPIKSYERARNALLENHATPPINPFDWD